MPTYKGFNTIGQYKKFGMTDFKLIKRDLMNAFLIREGEIAGRPDLGTKIWSYIFEPNTVDVRDELANEVRRIIAGDARLIFESLDISFNHNTVFIEVAVTLMPNYSLEKFVIKFERESQQISINDII